MTASVPILWSFRRCPYAMRGRLAVAASGVQVQLREILLRDKPMAFKMTSPKATVPVVDTGTRVLEESLDIMMWALGQDDPENWLDVPAEAYALIDVCDGPFKTALDHTKYAVRFPDVDATQERQKAFSFLQQLDGRLGKSAFLFGNQLSIADMAILPFVRQFANTDRAWLDAQGLNHLTQWLDAFLASDRFASIMKKYPPWDEEQSPVTFPS